ncbi:MAG TPA: ATP-binding protein [Terriglobales bacterium]|nr:ATP-binding protein [Terriglobales bacterium]
MGILEKIPTFLTVSVLVILFVYLKRYARSARLTLWAVGWALVFTHFLAQLLEPSKGQITPLLLALDLGALQAAAIAFLVSVSSVAEDYAKRLTLFLVLGVPSVAFAVFTGYEVQARWLYVACLALCFGGGACFFFWVHRRFSAYLAVMTLICACAGVWAARAAIRGSFEEGVTVLLGIGFALPGVFICRNYWRASPAILTISGGFFCWGLVFPLGMVIDRLAPHASIPGELWNMPKLFVAFGMILAIVEDKSESIISMQCKAEALNDQLQRFSEITSRLLSGTPAEAMCAEIALAITDVSGFGSVEIYLEDSERNLRIVGASRITGEHLVHEEEKLRHWTTDDIKSFCSMAPRLGQNSFVLPSSRNAPACADALLMPLRSAGGGCLGCIRLASPLDGEAIQVDELSRLESLATDLAVAVELKALHRQLVWSEKLAGLGQLVAGVAHELNNPLAVIMGYGELMGDEVSSARQRDQLDKIVAESRRMKKIIENLLRFSRQSAADVHSVQFAPVLQEVLALREYYLRTHNVRVEAEISTNLSPLAIHEDEIKQILLNLLNNSSDALESVSGEKRICIRAVDSGGRVRIEVEDTGPGFANLSRALDPFYTTKPVGKGTGLGLSVCYGIVKERGGDLRIENVMPRGARVTIELPAAEVPAQTLVAAVAHA